MQERARPRPRAAGRAAALPSEDPVSSIVAGERQEHDQDAHAEALHERAREPEEGFAYDAAVALHVGRGPGVRVRARRQR